MGEYLQFRPLMPAKLDTSARIIGLALAVGWLPAAVGSLIAGNFLPGGEVGWNCFLYDPLVVSIVVALPIIVLLGRNLEVNLNQTLGALHRGGILPEGSAPFGRALELANRVQSSPVVLIVCAVAAGLAGIPLLVSHVIEEVPTWWGSGGMVTFAGLWFTFVLNTFFLYITYNWAVRGIMWAWVVVGVSRSELRLNPTHPDRCCGLMTFSRSATRWAVIVAVTGVVIACHIGSTVFMRGLPLLRTDIVIQGTAYIVSGPIIALVPLFSFTPQLLRARRRAELSLSYFASGYARALRARIRDGAEDPLALDASISGLADMYALYENVTTLRWAPLDLRGLLRVLAFLFGPFIPHFLPAIQEWVLGLVWLA